MVIDWGGMLLGLSIGVPVSALFFAGLAWGVRLALRSGQPQGWLLLSAALRIAILLGVGFWIAVSATDSWPLAGYALGFFLVRLVVVLWARVSRAPGMSEQEGG